MKTYSMCKKCPNGCCKSRVEDTLDKLWVEICSIKSEQISMFGDGALISLSELQKLIEESKENKND